MQALSDDLFIQPHFRLQILKFSPQTKMPRVYCTYKPVLCCVVAGMKVLCRDQQDACLE